MKTCANAHLVPDDSPFCPECGRATIPVASADEEGIPTEPADEVIPTTTPVGATTVPAEPVVQELFPELATPLEPESPQRSRWRQPRPLVVVLVVIAVIGAIALATITLSGPSNSAGTAASNSGNTGNSGAVANGINSVLETTNYCGTDLTDYAIEDANGEEISVLQVFGDQSPVWADIEKDFVVYEQGIYRVGQTQAVANVLTMAANQCTQLAEAGVYVGRLPRAANYTDNSDGSANYPQPGPLYRGNTGNSGSGNTGQGNTGD